MAHGGTLADIYFVFGAVIEQERLMERFGGDYIEYSKKVPLLFPRPSALLGALLRRVGRHKEP